MQLETKPAQSAVSSTASSEPILTPPPMPLTELQLREDAELLGLEAKRRPLDQQATAQLIGTGKEDPDLKAQRQAIIYRIEELANAKTARAPLVLAEELARLKYEQKLAFGRRQAKEANVRAAKAHRNGDVQRQVDEADAAIVAAQNEDDGLFSCTMRIGKFKQLHPNIIDPEEGINP